MSAMRVASGHLVIQANEFNITYNFNMDVFLFLKTSRLIVLARRCRDRSVHVMTVSLHTKGLQVLDCSVSDAGLSGS